MVTRETPWPQGTPAWVDITVSDLGRSQQFYSGLFGWTFTDSSEEMGGYTNALLDGRTVAGMSPPMPGAEDAGHEWTVYLAVDDAQAAHRALTEAGATAAFEPMEVGPFGTMAIYADPTGAVFGTWQSGEHTGWQVWQDNGAACWAEAMVSDFERGKAFYQKAFGFEVTDMSVDGTPYGLLRLPGSAEDDGVAGIAVPEEGGPHWLITFAVPDVDATAEKASSSGGAVAMAPFDMEYGRYAVVTGPDGEKFGLLAAAEM